MENINQNHHPGLLRDDSPHSHGHPDYMNGKIIVTSLIIIVILIIIIIAFHVYGRWFWRRRRTSMSWRGRHMSHEKSPTGGLDKAIVDSLPTFTYTTRLHHDSGDVVSKEVGASVVECAVCLNEFQDDDACRLLPRCNHSFHTDCIDMWFLSNTTCPMCRTSAQVVDSDNAHLAESSAAFLLPCQDIQMTGLSSTACTMPRVDTGNRIQRSRSSSLLGREHEQGPGPHVRGILMRTCSSRVDASYNMVGEQMHNIDTMSGLMCNDRSERHGNGERAHSHLSHSGQAALLRRLPFPNWRRSVSDRFLNMRQFVQFPSTVRFGRNGNALSNTDHWQVGGRSLPHIIIDVPRPAGDNFLAPRFASSSPLWGISTDEQRCILPPPVQRQPSQMCP